MGIYINLVDIKNPAEKEVKFFDDKRRYISSDEGFKDVPGKSYAYWISKDMIKVYEKSEPITNYIESFQGIISGNNEVLLRFWYEVGFQNIVIGIGKIEEVDLKKTYWIPYNKGGAFKKWYGLQDYVINWKNGPDDKTRGKKGFSKFYLNEYVAWSYTVSNSIAARFYPEGFLWDVRGSGIFGKTEDILYLQGFICSKVAYLFFKIDSSVMSCQVENVLNFPIIMDTEKKQSVNELVLDNNRKSKDEWDEYEESWCFLRHPLIGENNTGKLIKDIFIEYSEACEKRVKKVRENEIELNKIFIKIYGLENELSPEVNDNGITLKKTDVEREVKSLISYAIGCIMGRYSLKEDGLIYAGGEWVASRYGNSFKPCEYGVMLITEEQYFEEDLCTRVIDFIEVVYGKDTLNENLNFIAQALKPGTKDSSRKVIRDYLYDEKGFFDNHYQIYQHRPIYWMMSSGKNGGFRAIIYMHRYNQNTLSIVRSEFLHELRYKYEADHSLQHKKEVEAATTADRNDAIKKIASLDKKIVEVNQYDDLINHATGNITAFTFDLDDGVKINYGKFLNIDGVKTQNLLVPIKL